PETDGGLGQGVFIAQGTQTGGAEEEEPAGGRFPPKPTRGQDAEEEPARKKQHGAWPRADSPHQTNNPRAHLLRAFTTRATIPKQSPIRPLRVNLHAAAALVLTVVPFEQIRFNPANRAKTSQFARARRALQRAGQNSGKGQPAQPLAEAAG